MSINKQIEKIPFFFIIGRPRSGTTLIQSLFDAHPNVVIPLESPIIINLYNKYGKKTYWSEKLLLELYNDLFYIRKFENWFIDKEKLKSELLACTGNNSFENIIKVIYLNYQSIFSKKEIILFGDKNPVYSLYIKKLTKIFPDAKFVYIIRDYRDHILSVKKVKLLLQSTAIIAIKWKKSLQAVDKYKYKYPARFFTFRYEDFVSSPEEYMKKICLFLEIDFYSEAFLFYKKLDEIISVDNKDEFMRFHSSLLKPITTNSIGKWKNELPEREVKIADKICGKVAEKYEYSQKFKNFSIKIYLFIFPRLFYLKLQSLLSILMEFLPFKTNMKIRNKKPLLTTIYFRLIRKNKYRALNNEI